MMLPAQIEHWVSEMQNTAVPLHTRMQYFARVNECVEVLGKELDRFSRATKVKPKFRIVEASVGKA